ncbi:MAG TPA: c-type cytochrome, partial [Gaiellaceae bacterium]|nr:c-type cytochrome [Gaiellaceae bacterium]
VKFLKRLAFTEQESDADIMVSSYRMRPIGEDSDPSQPTCWEHNVKSFVTLPANEAQVPVGPVRVVGVADGNEPVERVEVSTDGGQSWNEAEFYGADLGRYAWRRFTYVFEAEPGSYPIASRATDAAGNTQPEQRDENEAGWKTLFTAEAEPPCGSCHTLADAGTSGSIGPNLDDLQPSADRVQRAMREGPGAMPSYAESLSDDDRTAVADYVEGAAGG